VQIAQSSHIVRQEHCNPTGLQYKTANLINFVVMRDHLAHCFVSLTHQTLFFFLAEVKQPVQCCLCCCELPALVSSCAPLAVAVNASLKSSVYSDWQETVRVNHHLPVKLATVNSYTRTICINWVCITWRTGSLPAFVESPSDEKEKPFMSPAHQIAITFKPSAGFS